jgi:hypothetical protein
MIHILSPLAILSLVIFVENDQFQGRHPPLKNVFAAGNAREFSIPST